MLIHPIVIHNVPDIQKMPSPIEKGAAVRKLAGGFEFTEGPACDSEGNVYFTDQPKDRIWIWTTGGELKLFMEPSGRSNGLCFDEQGRLWACADENNELWRIFMDHKVEKIVGRVEGKLLNGPNDVWLQKDGGAFFTDPYYKRPYWNRGDMEQKGQDVYWVSPDRKQVKRVVSDMTQPNGIIGTPDGKTLYVADIGAGQTFSYRIGANGALTHKKLFCSMGSDGMTIDSEGNVYLTGHGVTVFSKSGEQVAQIPIDEPWTGNVCFGGKDRRTLFITASKGLYALAMRTHGVGSQ